MKRITKNIAAVVFIIITIVGLLVSIVFFAVNTMACGSSNTDVLYDSSNTDIRLITEFKVNNDTEPDSLYYESTSSRDEILDSYEFSIPTNNAAVYTTAKKNLTNFFKEEYGIDVSSKLEEIRTYEFEVDTSLYGFSYEGNIYIGTLSSNNFSMTWIHEAIHCLGFGNTEENANYVQLYEAATSALTEQFKIWNNLNTNTEDGYSTIHNYCRQLFTVNPELVINQLNGTELIEDAINNELADATYPYLDTKSFTIAEYYNILFSCVLNYGDYDDLHFQLQEITTAYCRRFNLDKNTIKKLQSLYFFEYFENCIPAEEDGTYYLEIQEA